MYIKCMYCVCNVTVLHVDFVKYVCISNLTSIHQMHIRHQSCKCWLKAHAESEIGIAMITITYQLHITFQWRFQDGPSVNVGRRLVSIDFDIEAGDLRGHWIFVQSFDFYIREADFYEHISGVDWPGEQQQ